MNWERDRIFGLTIYAGDLVNELEMHFVFMSDRMNELEERSPYVKLMLVTV